MSLWRRTRYRGLLLAVGILLPLAAHDHAQDGQTVPPAAPPPVTPAPVSPTPPVSPAAPAKPTPPTAPPKAAPAYTIEWKRALDSRDLSAKVVVTSTVVVTAGNVSVMRAYARANGDELWASDHDAWRGLTAGEGLIFGVTKGAIEARDETTGAVRWTTSVTDALPHIVVERGWLLVADGGVLTAYRATDGSVVWRIDLGTPVTTTPAVGAVVVLIGLSSQEMAAVDLKAGTLLWKAPLSGVAEHVSLSDQRFFVALNGGMACAYDLPRGTRRWCYDFHIPLVGAPLIEGKTITIALFDNTIRRLDAGNGAVRRQDKIGARPATAPIATKLGTLVPLTDAELGMFAADFKALPRVPTANPLVTQALEDVSVMADASAIATIAVAPGGRQTLALYKQTPPPPAPVTPPATAPAKSDGTASGTPPGSPATSPETAAPASTTAPPATAP
ncbi:MAG: PQQ-binding-like beta-propeller repeat protein [Acidobacteriota bacterium]